MNELVVIFVLMVAPFALVLGRWWYELRRDAQFNKEQADKLSQLMKDDKAREHVLRAMTDAWGNQ